MGKNTTTAEDCYDDMVQFITGDRPNQERAEREQAEERSSDKDDKKSR